MSVRKTDGLPDGKFYTGNASLEVSVQNEKSMEKFTEWLQNAQLDEYDWFCVAIFLTPPACIINKTANHQKNDGKGMIRKGVA